jgi:hypothetical protein
VVIRFIYCDSAFAGNHGSLAALTLAACSMTRKKKDIPAFHYPAVTFLVKELVWRFLEGWR